MIAKVIEDGEIRIIRIDFIRKFYSEASGEWKVLFGQSDRHGTDEWSESFTPSKVEESDRSQFLVQVYQAGDQITEFKITEDEILGEG